jgi:hypothetical protein
MRTRSAEKIPEFMASVRFSVEREEKEKEGISEELCPARGRKETPCHVHPRGKVNTEAIGGARIWRD